MNKHGSVPKKYTGKSISTSTSKPKAKPGAVKPAKVKGKK